MVKVICEHSGLEFEAKTTRSKSHPRVSDLKNRAYRENNYSDTMSALGKARRAGGYSTIEEYMKLVSDIMAGESAKHDAAILASRKVEAEAEQARREVKIRREAQNAFLKQHGYNWQKDEIIDFDQYEEYDARYAEFVWNLITPDGRIVTVEQALAEIERGVEVVLAEIEAKNQADAEEDARHQAAKTAEEAKFQAAKTSVKTVEVERFDYTGFTTIYESKIYHPATIIDQVFSGQINGVDCGVVCHYFGGNDYDERVSYYCTNPEAAGLSIVIRSGFSQTLADFFGG